MDAFSGVESIDDINKIAVVKGGSKLAYLSREFSRSKQAFMNMPDINTQTLAGALSTGTHGTGKAFMAMHAYVKALKLVTPEGEVIECNETKNPDVFNAAKVSLGTLGAITQYTLQNREEYKTHRVVTFETLENVLKNQMEQFLTNDQFEIFYIPHTGRCQAIKHNETNKPIRPKTSSEDEDSLGLLKSVRDWAYWAPSLLKFVDNSLMKEGEVTEDYIDYSWRLLSQARVTKFIESEYHIPIGNGAACMREVVKYIDSRKDTYFPIEMRVTKKDDAWLTPFQQNSCSIAVHGNNKEEYKYFLKDVGPISRKYGGRPRWGKMNDLTGNDFRKLYPH